MSMSATTLLRPMTLSSARWLRALPWRPLEWAAPRWRSGLRWRSSLGLRWWTTEEGFVWLLWRPWEVELSPLAGAGSTRAVRLATPRAWMHVPISARALVHLSSPSEPLTESFPHGAARAGSTEGVPLRPAHKASTLPVRAARAGPPPLSALAPRPGTPTPILRAPPSALGTPGPAPGGHSVAPATRGQQGTSRPLAPPDLPPERVQLAPPRAESPRAVEPTAGSPPAPLAQPLARSAHRSAPTPRAPDGGEVPRSRTGQGASPWRGEERPPSREAGVRERAGGSSHDVSRVSSPSPGPAAASRLVAPRLITSKPMLRAVHSGEPVAPGAASHVLASPERPPVWMPGSTKTVHLTSSPPAPASDPRSAPAPFHGRPGAREADVQPPFEPRREIRHSLETTPERSRGAPSESARARVSLRSAALLTAEAGAPALEPGSSPPRAPREASSERTHAHPPRSRRSGGRSLVLLTQPRREADGELSSRGAGERQGAPLRELTKSTKYSLISKYWPDPASLRLSSTAPESKRAVDPSPGATPISPAPRSLRQVKFGAQTLLRALESPRPRPAASQTSELERLEGALPSATTSRSGRPTPRRPGGIAHTHLTVPPPPSPARDEGGSAAPLGGAPPSERARARRGEGLRGAPASSTPGDSWSSTFASEDGALLGAPSSPRAEGRGPSAHPPHVPHTSSTRPAVALSESQILSTLRALAANHPAYRRLLKDINAQVSALQRLEQMRKI